MHFKRKRPKSARAGCQLCKPHKRNGCGGLRHENMTWGNRRRSEAVRDQMRCERQA